MPKGAHHQGTYHADAAKIRAEAYGDPATRCWRCGLTLAQVRRFKNPRAFWTAGHVVDGRIGGELRAECSVDNFSRGARRGNALRGLKRRRRFRTTREW